MKNNYLISIVLFFVLSLQAQQNPIQEQALKYLETLHKPAGVEVFKAPFHFPPLNQDTTNACWSFATNSFLETEMARLGKDPVKLSMMYNVYYAFVEKARYFVKTKGASRFAGGDLFSGVLLTIKKYGTVPYTVYAGTKQVGKTFNHSALESELFDFMAQVKEIQLWDEDLVVQRVREILDRHLGAPPVGFEFEGKRYTPQSFRDQRVDLPWDDYVVVTSFMYAPYNRFIELRVPDNWAHRKDYFNVSLDRFYGLLRSALDHGFTVAFDSDTGEPGRIGKADAVFVPPFDIPSDQINAVAREMRFNSGATTDDHLMHMLAAITIDGQDWFLVKDSWRTAWDGQAAGYYYFHGDYVKLKVLAFMAHKDAFPQLQKFWK